jgi:hypothetical protein
MTPPQRPLQPITFGPPARRLFGMLHAAELAGTELPGVVLCKPFGQEAIRSHRLFRVLAERLARAGHAVLRFDPFGTGDALGDDADADLDGWAADLRVADQELRSLTRCPSTVWVGMRLGGEVALRAARQASTSLGSLSRLVVFDLVIDGPRYLEHLRERHATSLAKAFSLPRTPSPISRLADAKSYRDEAVGFLLPPALRNQLAAMTPASFSWPTAPRPIVALSDPEDADGRDLAAVLARGSTGVEVVAVSHHTDWTRDTADNTALVPSAALQALVRSVGVAE